MNLYLLQLPNSQGVWDATKSSQSSLTHGILFPPSMTSEALLSTPSLSRGLSVSALTASPSPHCCASLISFSCQAIPVTFSPWAAAVRKSNHPFWGGFCPIQSCFVQEYYIELENKVYMFLSKTPRMFFFLSNLPYYFQSFCQCGRLTVSNLCSTMFWVLSLFILEANTEWCLMPPNNENSSLDRWHFGFFK